MADMQTKYNDIVDTFLAMARITELGYAGLDMEELLSRLTQAIRVNLPDKDDDLSEGSDSNSSNGELNGDADGVYALAALAKRTADTALDEARAPKILEDDVVKTDSDDAVAGYLDDEITVTPADLSFSWLSKTAYLADIPTGDRKLRILHGPWDSDNLASTVDVIADVGIGNGLAATDVVPDEAGYISYTKYFDQYDANNHSQLSENPNYTRQYIAIPYYLVKVEAGGVEGFLKAKITTTPAAGDNWLEQSVVNDTLLIQHSTLDPAQLNVSSSIVEVIDTGAGGVNTSGTAAAGYCSFLVNNKFYNDDAAGHSEVSIVGAANNTVSWLALPTDASTDDIITWDGGKWIAEAPPAVSTIPDGTTAGDMLVWSGSAWILLAAPAGTAVLVHDTTGTRWQTLTNEYDGVFKCGSAVESTPQKAT